MQAIERRKTVTISPEPPRFEDLDLFRHIQEADEAEKDFEMNYVSLEEVMKEYERKHKAA
ncbi:MAG: hypothetical protein Q4Q04_01070 [Methanocorpusculum sp.]|nr:hypothetical protein [Methanocorpusculum sp.]